MTLLDKLFEIKEDLEAIGLIMTRDFESYFCTPLQAVIFAHSGTDGIHYCIVKNDKELHESPVYIVSPSMSDNYVELVGRNLVDFLSLVVKCKDAVTLECISYTSEI
ncbi:hypothetical protein [Acetivibrio cellulolyticus]|uniref:hypothetical protein n=1 Tax=Acetivibrio cellulolyticus TaxID=35830 RepID=UPI0001E2C7AE|nr:hypothetical protein [Acetivibrio cellulolyticus]